MQLKVWQRGGMTGDQAGEAADPEIPGEAANQSSAKMRLNWSRSTGIMVIGLGWSPIATFTK